MRRSTVLVINTILQADNSHQTPALASARPAVQLMDGAVCVGGGPLYGVRLDLGRHTQLSLDGGLEMLSIKSTVYRSFL